MWCTYKTEYYSAIKIENPVICVNMDETGGALWLSKISQTEKAKYCMVSLIYKQ